MITTLSARYTTWVSEASPNAVNFGKTGYIAACNATGARAESIVWFTSPFTDDGGNVLSSKLRLVTRALPAGTHTLTVRLLDPWSTRFNSTHWANRPGASSATVTVTKTGAQPDGTVWEFDVRALMQAIANGQAFYGFAVRATTAGMILIDNFGTRRPSLTTDWSLAPLPPTALSPSGGRSVGVARPVLRLDFRDSAGEVSMRALRVQTAATSSGFGSPAWDSGEVLTSWAELDLATTTFPAPPASSVTWWRVQVQDSAGLWSGWSQPTSWAYHAQPTLTLTTPGAGTVADPTPPVTAGFTSSGSPLSKWRAGLYRQNGSRWDVIDSSGWRYDSPIDWTPGRGMTLTGLHRVVVDAWDSRSREAVPGSPDYVTVSRDITFAPSASVPSVTALAASSKRLAPEVTLTWNRSQAPDEWYISRDDRVLARVPGPSLLTGGTAYRFVDNHAPRGEHTYKVFAIVNKVSSLSAAAAVDSTLLGTWLVEPESGARVCIIGDADHGTTLTEVSAEHWPTGSRSAVIITSALHGESGRVDGLVAPIDPTLPQQARVWRDQLVAWRSRKGLLLRLLHEGTDVAVEISQVTRAGYPGHAGRIWKVGFNFRQVAEFESSME